MLKNTKAEYGDIAKIFHWTVGLAILAMLPFGFYMEGVSPENGKYALYGIHKSIGIMILTLVGARFLWRLYCGTPEQMMAHPKWERILAETVHYALYLAAFLMPLSGWGMSSAGGHPVAFFGLPIPPLVGENKELGAFFSGAHSVLAWTLIALVGLHIAGALKHVIIDRDETLKRMLP